MVRMPFKAFKISKGYKYTKKRFKTLENDSDVAEGIKNVFIYSCLE